MDLNLNSDTERYPPDGEDTNNLGKYHNFDDDMAPFDKKIVQFIQNLHFNTNWLNFVFVWIPCFDAKIVALRTNVDETTFNPIWYFPTSFTFKTLIIQYQAQFPLRHRAKKWYVI